MMSASSTIPPTASAGQDLDELLDSSRMSFDVTPVFHPAATRDRPLLSRRSACEATGGFKPARCFSSSAANAAGVA